MLGALLIGLGALILQTVPPEAPDRSEHYEDIAPLPPLLPDVTVTQQLAAVQSGDLHVLARFGTYTGAQDCEISVRVTSPGGEVQSSRVLECADLPDNSLTEVASVPAARSRPGEPLLVTFHAAADATEAVALWGGEAEGRPPARVDGKVLDESVELYTRYGTEGRLFDRLGSVLSRMQQYRAWWGAPALTILFFVVMVGGLAGLLLVPARVRLPLLLVVVAAKGILWSVLLPPLETPDEPAHFAYSQFVGEELRIPDRYHRHDGLDPYSDQLLTAIDVVHQPLLNPGDRPDFGPGPQGPGEHRPDARSPHSGGGGNPAAGYAPPYFIGAAVAYALPPDDFFTTLSTMRLWSVGLGVFAIWLVVGIGRRALRDEAAALALGVAVAFHPVWTQATAAVNNDAAVVVAGAACTLVALDLALNPGRHRLALIAGLTLGAALLTKPFAAAFAGPMVIGWVIGSARIGAPWRRWAQDVARAAFGVAVTFGAWMAISVLFGIPMVTNDDTGATPGSRTPGQYLHQLTLRGWHNLHLNWVERLWGNLSWTDTPPPPAIVRIESRLTVLALLLVVAWVVCSVVDVVGHRWRAMSEERAVDLTAGVVLLSATVSTLGLLHLIELRWFLRTGDTTLLSGRYAMMTVPAIIAAVPVMLRRLVPRAPIWATTIGFAALIVALHLTAIDTVLDRFYL